MGGADDRGRERAQRKEPEVELAHCARKRRQRDARKRQRAVRVTTDGKVLPGTAQRGAAD